MLILGIWILFVSETAFGNVINCNDTSYCTPADKFPITIPGNEIELDTFCSVFTEYLHCLKNHVISCGGEIGVESFDRQFETLARMCNPDSALRKALVDNIECIRDMLKESDERCWKERYSLFESYEQYLGKTLFEMEFEEGLVLICLENTFHIGCFLRGIEACGTEAKRVSREIIQGSNYNDGYCIHDSKEKALLLLENLELKYHQDTLVLDLLLMDEENK